MAQQSDQPAKDFSFLPVYANYIAHAANNWAYLEYYIVSSIWEVAEVKPAIGACLTSQMYTFNAKLAALLSLLKLRKVSEELIKKVNKFSSSCRDALDARNRIVHDIWLRDKLNPEQMGKLRITADKELRFGIEEIEIKKLKADVELIEKRRLEAAEIRRAIRRVLPALPELRHTELHPIIESPVD